MTIRRVAYLLAAAVGTAAAFLPAYGTAWAGSMTVDAAGISATQISVQWTFYEDPLNPVAHPEWIGYDVYRRTPADCGAWVRITSDPVPRVVGQTHTATVVDTPPESGPLCEYRVWMVDAARQQVLLGPTDCSPPCSPPAYASCPALASPLVVGTVSDLGWAVLLSPCSGTCLGSFYVENPAAESLRTHAGTGEVVRAFGIPYCGTVEGCGMFLDHYDLSTCGSTPARRTTWGRLKLRYR
jgi:hypothetical protein